MIMPRGQQRLLLPAKLWFIALSLLAALFFDLLPIGQAAAMPSVLAVVLVFWNIHQSRFIGVGWAFLFGLIVDVNHGAVMGQHALAYSGLAYAAVSLHRRLQWFNVVEQMLLLLPMFALAHGLQVVVRLMVGGMVPSWTLLLAPVFETLLWPLAYAILLAPQRRAPDPDEHRPL